jgi:hypothetical protein
MPKVSTKIRYKTAKLANLIGREPYPAERHLILGTAASASILGKLEYDWYKSIAQPHTAHLYVSRFLFPYLLLGNLASASSALGTFISELLNSSAAPPSEQLASEVSASGIKIFPSLPLMNFLSLLVLSCQRMQADLYRQLKSHYRPWLGDPDIQHQWNDSLASIGEMYFGIRIPQQGNPLMDMMGSLLGGGLAPSRPERQRITLQPTTPEAPSAEGLD